VSTVVARVVAGAIVAAVIACVVAKAVVAAVIARLGGTVATVVARLGLTPAALDLRRREGAVDANCLDLDDLTGVQRAESGDVVEARAGCDGNVREDVAMLAIADRERP
jgi:hypothetical protein